MTENNVQTVSVITADLFPEEERFEMHLGGTTYEISTHFNPDGRESVLGQFLSLIQKEDLVPHI